MDDLQAPPWDFMDLMPEDDEALFSSVPVDVPALDRRDSDDMAIDAEKRGDLKRAKAIAKRIKYHSTKTAQIAAFEEVGLPVDCEIITAITTGSFNAYTIILFAIREFGHIDRLSVTTFNMHQDVIADLFARFDAGEIGAMDIIISESVRFRMPARFDQMCNLFKSHQHTGKIRVKFNWNHSKILLMQCNDNRYVVTGSGNLSDNAQFEQYHLSCNMDDYDFFRRWIDKEFESQNRKREIIL